MRATTFFNGMSYKGLPGAIDYGNTAPMYSYLGSIYHYVVIVTLYPAEIKQELIIMVLSCIILF